MGKSIICGYNDLSTHSSASQLASLHSKIHLELEINDGWSYERPTEDNARDFGVYIGDIITSHIPLLHLVL